MILKHKDTELLRFDWVKPFGVKNVELNSSARQFLPLDLRKVNEKANPRQFDYALEEWLLSRTMPIHRSYVKEILASLGFDPKDPRYLKELVELCKGLSLNDVYWIDFDDNSLKWDEINLYDNEFSKELAEIAFSGAGKLKKAFTTSPEITTNGVLAKCWRREKDGIYLYKAGKEGKGDEPYAEYYAAQVAAAMNLPHVDYRLAKYKGKVCSVCKLFTSKDTSFIPARRLMGREDAVKDSRFFDIFLFDAVIMNSDRHLGNLGFLIDNNTNEISGVAPIFDNGLSIFSQPNPQKFSKSATPAMYKEWLGFTDKLSSDQMARLATLKTFLFKRDKYYNIPADRLAMILKLQQNNIDEILAFGEITKDNALLSLENDTETPTEIGAKIIKCIQKNPFVTRPELVRLTDTSISTIARKLKEMQESGKIVRVGADKGGHWEVR